MKKISMLTYIEETPKQLSYNNKHIKELTKSICDLYMEKEYRSIWIIACGSSYNASQCAKPFMIKYLNCDVKIISPNTFIYLENKLKDDDFICVVSQSGCSTNAINALKKLKELGKKAIGITGNIDSDFKEYADIVIDYGVGKETVGYVTKGVTTLAQFFMLFALRCSLKKQVISNEKYNEVINELYEIPQRHEIIQKETWEFYEYNKKVLTSMQFNYLCGFMQGYGIALEGALKIGETVKIPSFAYEAEEYIHGPDLQLTPNYTVWCIDDCDKGSERIHQIYKAIRSVTDQAFMITNDSNVDDQHSIRLPFKINEPLLSPLYILPVFQIIAYQVSEELDSWDNHPMFKDFRDIVKTKTETIHKIMND